MSKFGDKKAEANAEFVVLACNSHQKLLKACKAALASMTNPLDYGHIPPFTRENSKRIELSNLAVDLLRAAIEEAERKRGPR